MKVQIKIMRIQSNYNTICFPLIYWQHCFPIRILNSNSFYEKINFKKLQSIQFIDYYDKNDVITLICAVK